jgi:MerR family mercuric resistance operon transcriptional regulator
VRAQAGIGIGELARRTQCNIETIRYYERIGLLPQPRRGAGRYRRYDADDVGRLKFIRRARQLGFTLDEVRTLMALAATKSGDVRSEARRLAAAQLGQVRAKIADLQAMERTLVEAIRACEAGEQPNCPLIAALSGENPAAPIGRPATA